MTPRDALIELWAANEGEVDTLNELVDAIEADQRARLIERVKAKVAFKVVYADDVIAILEERP